MSAYRYYFAYGSNLNLSRMAQRCPSAIPVGRAMLDNYRLLFKGSKSGNYLTVEPYDGSKVPVVVWKITALDEAALDRYEGFPTFYYKTYLDITMRPLDDNRRMYRISGLIYIMHEYRLPGAPTMSYYSVCAEGYRRFGFDMDYLRDAVVDSVGLDEARRISRAFGSEF